ncbi:MAG: helix-turn-helix domain-containing protein, partial [Cyanobacteria bacterium P01_A01_bin.135]
ASQEQLDLDEPPTQDRHNTPDLDNRTTLVVVPCLEQCFLRCIDGWSAVEYLRSVAIRNRNCFWVFGCNQLAWNFLDFVSQISAYFGQVVTLPELDGDNLRDWLDPIGQTVIESSQQQDTLQSWLDPLRQQAVEIEQGKDAEDDPRQIYWSSLATQCLGVGAIAARLWQRSLRVTAEEELPPLDPPDQEDKEAGNASRPEPARLTLHQTAPTLPSLPNLTAADRYLLHALLIHGEMTRPHLALSLGETDSETQATVQKLLREDLLEQRHDTLSVQPIYYPKLKTDLGNNNFFLEGE